MSYAKAIYSKEVLKDFLKDKHIIYFGIDKVYYIDPSNYSVGFRIYNCEPPKTYYIGDKIINFDSFFSGDVLDGFTFLLISIFNKIGYTIPKNRNYISVYNAAFFIYNLFSIDRFNQYLKYRVFPGSVEFNKYIESSPIYYKNKQSMNFSINYQWSISSIMILFDEICSNYNEYAIELEEKEREKELEEERASEEIITVEDEIEVYIKKVEKEKKKKKAEIEKEKKERKNRIIAEERERYKKYRNRDINIAISDYYINDIAGSIREYYDTINYANDY